MIADVHYNQLTKTNMDIEIKQKLNFMFPDVLPEDLTLNHIDKAICELIKDVNDEDSSLIDYFKNN